MLCEFPLGSKVIQLSIHIHSFLRYSFLLWLTLDIEYRGFPGGASSEEPACQCRTRKRCGFSPWVGKIPWSKAWQPTAEFLPREFHGQRSLAGYSLSGYKELDLTDATECAYKYHSWSIKYLRGEFYLTISTVVTSISNFQGADF